MDRLTTELLAAGQPEARDRLARVAANTTGSLDALKSYLTGERELRRAATSPPKRHLAPRSISTPPSPSPTTG